MQKNRWVLVSTAVSAVLLLAACGGGGNSGGTGGIGGGIGGGGGTNPPPPPPAGGSGTFSGSLALPSGASGNFQAAVGACDATDACKTAAKIVFGTINQDASYSITAVPTGNYIIVGYAKSSTGKEYLGCFGASSQACNIVQPPKSGMNIQLEAVSGASLSSQALNNLSRAALK